MQAKIKIAAAVVIAAGTVTLFWSGAARDGERTPAPAPSASRRGFAGGGGDSGASTPAPMRRALAESPARTPRSQAPVRVTVRGVVRDCSGAPLAGAPVVARGDDGGAGVVTDAGGAFELALLPQPTSITVDGERFITVLGAEWSPESSFAPVVIAAPAIRVAGRVLDTAGAAVGGAQVALLLPDDFDARFPVLLDRGKRQRWQARSGEGGAFDLGRIPRIDGAVLFAAADAFQPLRVSPPLVDDEHMEVVLTKFAYEQGQLEGVVVDLQGTPVAGARVAMGVTSVVSDDDGRFALSLRRAGWPTPIVAAKAGYLPAHQPVPKNGGARPEDWPRRLVLQLGASPLSIRGRVVDQDGTGIAGALVWVTDPTLLGIVAILPMYTEFLLAGGEVPAGVARMRVPLQDDPTRDDNFIDMNSDTPPPSAGWFYVTADADGAFELPGLLARDYALRAIDPVTGLTGDAAPIAAGGSADIRITRQGLWSVVRGRVVTLRGEPLAGIEIKHSVRMFTANERVPGGRFEGNAMREVATVRSGADGTFELHDVSPTATVLGFHGDAILPRSLTADRIDPAKCTVVVEARCHVEVALADASEADQVAAQDVDGQPVDITVLRSGSHQAFTEIGLHDGRSGVFVLGERASRLLLLRQGAVVREVPLALRPGTTQRVQ